MVHLLIFQHGQQIAPGTGYHHDRDIVALDNVADGDSATEGDGPKPGPKVMLWSSPAGKRLKREAMGDYRLSITPRDRHGGFAFDPLLELGKLAIRAFR
jgi:hypothetical protein